MARPAGARTTLIAITYDTIGELAGGIAGDTARQYAQRGQFDSRNLDSLLAWVNARRQRAGLPMIGAPSQRPDDPVPTSRPIPPAAIPTGGYDPLTGSYREHT